MKKLYSIWPGSAPLIIYEPFVWPDLDYSDIVYDQPKNQFFNKIVAV